MPEYLVLIYENEALYATASQEVMAGVMKAHEEFGENCASSLRGGNALQPGHTGTSIRREESGEYITTDGPFAETKEGLGGYYVIEAADLDEAIRIAKQCPAPFGGVEVRPMMTFG
jgi:hypothetical protein